MGDGGSSCYLAPIHESGHWTLCVVCPSKNSCYWFDSVNGNPTEDIKNMFAEGLKTYRQLINAKEQGGPKWFKPTCHQQPGSTECGYYVMSWMQSIVNSGRTQGFQNFLGTKDPYSQDEIDSRDINITTVFSHSQTVVVCGNCQTVLCQPNCQTVFSHSQTVVIVKFGFFFSSC
ncbi:hypothetical protein K1719_002281 [Acacia pycnantha]|nr:hypothetical protein K1719_002281 [Acacia pycnantha]